MSFLDRLKNSWRNSPQVPPSPSTVEVPPALEELSIAGTSDGLWQWNLDTQRFRVSTGWAEILGWEPGDIGDKADDWFSLIHPYYVAGVRMDLAAHISGQKDKFESEYRIRHRDGSYRWVLCRGRVTRDDAGKAIEMAGFQTDVTRLIEVENRLVEEALHDRLTALPNRNFFYAQLERAIEKQRNSRKPPFAILFLDLDRFKEVNDTLGHLVGDALLASTAKRLRDSVRPEDFVARFGGDEFVILLASVKSRRDAESMAARVQATVAEPHLLDGQRVITNTSVGIVTSDSHYENAEKLIRNADIAMYQAKSDGKAKSRVFAPAMYETIERCWNLENELRGAIERQELSIVYQPQVSTRSGMIIGAEALLRWKHPDGRWIPPAEFIPLAEKSDLILEIGEWVLRNACEEAVRWQQSGWGSGPITKLSVNVSAQQLAEPGFPNLAAKIIDETGLAPDQVELELTETVLVESLEYAPYALEEIARHGIRLAIDDFGTGYSSMSYLRDLMPAIVKIDKTFIEDIGHDTSAGALAKGMIGLAHDLGLEVIAEGVEDGHQLAFLQANNCDLVQGYFASRPIPSAKLLGLLRKARPIIELSATASQPSFDSDDNTLVENGKIASALPLVHPLKSGSPKMSKCA